MAINWRSGGMMVAYVGVAGGLIAALVAPLYTDIKEWLFPKQSPKLSQIYTRLDSMVSSTQSTFTEECLFEGNDNQSEAKRLDLILSEVNRCLFESQQLLDPVLFNVLTLYQGRIAAMHIAVRRDTSSKAHRYIYQHEADSLYMIVKDKLKKYVI
jgi:hypothetical protein